MLDINLLRQDPQRVKENIKKKFQEEKLVLVDEVVKLDREFRVNSSSLSTTACTGRMDCRGGPTS
ncbi:hypothetical protein, partial [Bittarella massiliensis (ex Durand et al. 2017)]